MESENSHGSNSEANEAGLASTRPEASPPLADPSEDQGSELAEDADPPTVEAILMDARKNSPFPTSQLPGTKLAKASPTRFNAIHPMAAGIRQAKLEIAKILNNTNNLAILGVALQAEFDEDPTRFLRIYEPLLRRYEEMSTTPEEKRAVRVIVRTGDTDVAIES